MDYLKDLISKAELALGQDGHSDAAALIRRASLTEAPQILHTAAMRGFLIARVSTPDSPSVAACKNLADAIHPVVGFPSGGSARIAGSDSRAFWRSRRGGTIL